MNHKSLFLAVALLSAAACDKSDSKAGEEAANPTTQASEPAAAEARTIDVEANDKGFVPSNVSVKQGETVTLKFTRTSDTTCADKVVFPDLKIEKDLPLNKPVEIEVPTQEARTLTFQCGMGMYKSSVVVNQS